MHLNTVSIGAASTYIPSNCAKAFLSLHILLNSCYFFFLIKAFLEDMRSSHCGFDLYFLMIDSVEHVFMYLLASCMYSLKNIYSGSLPIKKNQTVCFLLLSCMSSLCILDNNPYQRYNMQIFSPIP